MVPRNGNCWGVAKLRQREENCLFSYIHIIYTIHVCIYFIKAGKLNQVIIVQWLLMEMDSRFLRICSLNVVFVSTVVRYERSPGTQLDMFFG